MKRIVVELSRYGISRTIKVYKGRIVVPRVASRVVEYVPSAHLITILLSILSIAVFLSMLVSFGPFSVGFLFVTASLIYAIDRRLKKSEVMALRQMMPEEKVISIVTRVSSLCKDADTLETSFKVDDTLIVARCGYPVKCIEYDRNKVSRYSAVYVAVLSALAILYSLGSTVLIIVSSIAGLAIVLFLGRKPICNKYLIKKINYPDYETDKHPPMETSY